MSLTGTQIREKFISYFRDKRGHLHLPSASLIPDNPTLLLTSAGMVPFVPIFLGQKPAPEPPRAVTVQKCARAGGKDSDIENVGRTDRHHTYFEMLGNFSFGDYFKKEVIPWAWEFVTKELGLEAEKISVSIFGGDEQGPEDTEAFEIWNKVVGVPAERIHKMSRKDNFWGPPGPTGPCGPCSEFYYDRGAEYSCSPDPSKCGIGICECDRYLEFWNLVFMEFFRDENGTFTPLARKNVDTGSGLERVATILQKKGNNYETDLLFPILQEAASLANVKYVSGKHEVGSSQYKINLCLKIITDHSRCVTFLVNDGVRPSNIGRGYVLRFILRRAARFGRLLGITEPFIYKLVPKITSIYQDYYRDLSGQEEMVASIIREEEERFAKTIEKGMTFLESILADGKKEISGKEAFNLYATYGFPVELTREIAEEQGKSVDMTAFAQAKKEHEEVSSVNKFNVIITGDEALGRILKHHGGTKFLGYKQLEGKGQVIAIIKDGKIVEHGAEGEHFEVVLDQTPFYAESGGQVGDTGILGTSELTLAVVDTKKHEGLHIHKVRALSGELTPEQTLEATVDKARRAQTVLHHSTAHLFHAAVRELLGKHVVQAGSQVGPDAMRFDFTFEKQLTPEQLAAVENLMNEWVRLNLPVVTQEMSIEEAKKTGAIAMFGEKYGDIVRVVKMGTASLEFCGGTHVSSTGEIGPVKIISEGSIASGVRRVEALSGQKAWHFISDQMKILAAAAEQLKIRPGELLAQIERLQGELKHREKIAAQLEEKLAMSHLSDLATQAEQIGDIRLVAQVVQDLSADGLKALTDALRNKGDDFVVVLGCALAPDKVSLCAGVSNALVKRGVNAGKLIKELATICGGGGGGRPELAQAGGKDPSKLGQAVAKARELLVQEIAK